ncbi:MAG: DUF433 domain-containing protein [Candidatus Anammoxibacter sp.]
MFHQVLCDGLSIVPKEITVEFVLELLASDVSEKDILQDYPRQ